MILMFKVKTVWGGMELVSRILGVKLKQKVHFTPPDS